MQCDDNEQAYLKVLMDEIFGRRILLLICWKKGLGVFQRDERHNHVGLGGVRQLPRSVTIWFNRDSSIL